MTGEMILGALILGFSFGMGCIFAQTTVDIGIYLYNRLIGVETDIY